MAALLEGLSVRVWRTLEQGTGDGERMGRSRRFTRRAHMMVSFPASAKVVLLGGGATAAIWTSTGLYYSRRGCGSLLLLPRWILAPGHSLIRAFLPDSRTGFEALEPSDGNERLRRGGRAVIFSGQRAPGATITRVSRGERLQRSSSGPLCDAGPSVCPCTTSGPGPNTEPTSLRWRAGRPADSGRRSCSRGGFPPAPLVLAAFSKTPRSLLPLLLRQGYCGIGGLLRCDAHWR